MRFRISAEDLSAAFELDLLSDLDPSALKPQTIGRDSEELKLVDGSRVYRVPVVVQERETGRVVQNASIKIKQPPQVKISRRFDLKLAGEIFLTPYVTSGGRQGFSIVADSIALGGEKNDAR